MGQKRQNYKGDFTIVEKFSLGYNQGTRPVPNRVRIEYFTKPTGPRWVVERNGSECKHCTLAADGNSLITNVALSKQQIGCGTLYHNVIEMVEDPGFPGGIRQIPTPAATDIFLWEGKTDNSPEIVSETVMQTFLYGYSAFELAKSHGYKGSEKDYALFPIEKGNEAQAAAQRANLAAEHLGGISEKYPIRIFLENKNSSSLICLIAKAASDCNDLVEKLNHGDYLIGTCRKIVTRRGHDNIHERAQGLVIRPRRAPDEFFYREEPGRHYRLLDGVEASPILTMYAQSSCSPDATSCLVYATTRIGGEYINWSELVRTNVKISKDGRDWRFVFGKSYQIYSNKIPIDTSIQYDARTVRVKNIGLFIFDKHTKKILSNIIFVRFHVGIIKINGRYQLQPRCNVQADGSSFLP